MIGTDGQQAKDICNRFRVLAGYDSLTDEVKAPFFAISETIVDPIFPGAVLPTLLEGGSCRIYVLASSATEWRKLRPLLMAFAGPTLTSFDGVPAELGSDRDVDAFLMTLNCQTCATIEIPLDRTVQKIALRALARVRESLHMAPETNSRPPEPTSWLIARFQDQINTGQREVAAATLKRLKAEFRIDSLNLRFLEVQLYFEFGDWPAIADMVGFESLFAARKPASITVALLETLFETRMRSAYETENLSTCRKVYEETCRALTRQTLSVVPPSGLRPGGWKLYALEALSSDTSTELRQELDCRETEIGWLSSVVGCGLTSITHRTSRVEEPLAKAQASLIAIETMNTLESLRQAVASIAALPPEERAKLLATEPFRSVWRESVGSDVSVTVPHGWSEWFERIGDPGFTNALDIARRGKDEWPIDDAAVDPAAIEVLLARLQAVPDALPASERAADALPFVVAWLQRDSGFPRAALQPVYRSLLTLFALGTRRGRGIYESTSILIHALLSLGLSQSQYRELLEDVDELLGAGVGVESVYWLLDIVEDTLRFGTPDSVARESFWHRAIAQIEPIRSRLSPFQRLSIAQIAASLGWSTEIVEKVAASDEGGRSVSRRLASKRVAIYTLTESSSRQAQRALENIAPGIVVECSADHVGTARLKAMAENADVFVITSLSAKHAATDFIKQHRSSRPLTYASGRGFTSILRAIEDQIASVQ